MRKPRPAVAPTSSAAISTRIAAAPEIRMPVKIVGTAAGKTTLRNVATGREPEHPRRPQQLRVDRRDAGDRAEQDREEAGVDDDRDLRGLADAEDQGEAGSSASAAVLRKTSSGGVRISRTGRYHAIAAPSGIASAIAMPKPAPDRTRLACRCVQSSPSTDHLPPRLEHDVSGGRK